MGRRAMTDKRLIEEFRARGVTRAGELYLRTEVALEYVHSCEISDMAVVGVEAFEVEDASIRPRIDLIFDCSSAEGANWNSVKKRCNKSATDFLQHLLGSDLLLAVEALSRDEWYQDI